MFKFDLIDQAAKVNTRQAGSVQWQNTRSKEKPWGEEVQDEEKEKKAGKLMRKSQKADPHDLNHTMLILWIDIVVQTSDNLSYIVKVNPPKGHLWLKSQFKDQQKAQMSRDTLSNAIARKAMAYTSGMLKS